MYYLWLEMRRLSPGFAEVIYPPRGGVINPPLGGVINPPLRGGLITDIYL
jgi:hypothetical protein